METRPFAKKKSKFEHGSCIIITEKQHYANLVLLDCHQPQGICVMQV